ncbi:lysophospholipase [Lentinus tigrinus ALCF2SS1-7]|uniref:Lysophospholipase n=1 Tax=Lentinus tigrinus ALCF2SS1-6 TaxID=1328759 RepID=A0A5C2S4Q9_9APHY|nr:lysophospholipase [Lentinus tigrinus ALCF2SS1-6]RPD70418.1 lysophospholipase [Lentinus tigrinus ALCF2SS1-7]
MAAPANSEQTYTEAWLPGRDGIKFYTRTYKASPARAVVIHCHGFAEYIARYEWAHGVYASRGITVFAFDQRGFGLTALDLKNKSKDSKYGKTSWHDQFADIEWWLKYMKDQYPTLPVFLMGHSMGGALCLGFVTRPSPPPAEESVKLVSGVVATSPLILLTNPPLRIARFLGMLASHILPTLVIPAPVNPDNLSHDKEMNAANARDPLCPQKGSVKGVHDMLTGGEQMLWNDYKNWNSDVPVLIVHGTADQVTSSSASKEFCDKISAKDKEYLPIEDGYHELVNESNGMKEKFVDDCISWILKHV